MTAPRDNVVNIGSSDEAAANMLARPLRHVVGLMQEHCSQRLIALFDQADDRLFELADRAESNAEQESYFEAMRLIRLQQQAICQRYNNNITEGLNARAAAKQTSDEQECDIASLSLIQNDDLEIQVAIAGMASRAAGQSPIAMRELGTRLDYLLKTALNNEEGNPLAPRKLAENFVAACADVDVEISLKLVLFKLFEKQVLVDLDGLYASCNAYLKAQNVLPDLNYSPVTRRSPKQATAADLSQPSAVHTEGKTLLDSATLAKNQQVFSGMQTLLAQQQQMLLGEDRFATARHFLPGLAPEIPQADLLSMLASLQQQNQQAALGMRGPIDVHAQLKALLKINENETDKSHSLGQTDFDSINLIAMLFQYILDDENLAAPMKALIARLQIPMLKVSMLDQAFFGTSDHPARQLLNAIATAALGWVPSNKTVDPLLVRVQEIVDTLLQSFDTDVGLFAELLHDFEKFVASEEKRAHLLERRVLNAEEGRERAQHSREYVNDVISTQLEGHDAPDALKNLLFDGWSNVLFIILLKEGEDSESWSQSLACMAELIDSVCTRVDAASLLKTVPPLLKRLREGLLQVGFDAFKMNQMFTELELVHLHRIRGLIDRRGQGKSGVVSEPEEQRSVDTRTASKQAESQSEINTIGHPTARVATSKPEPELDPVDPQSDEFRRAKSLQVGTWVEVRQGEGKRYRAKLADISTLSERYLFVNRSGMKVLDCCINDLARDLKRGRIALLDDGALFDRALQNVIGNLRSSRSGAMA